MAGIGKIWKCHLIFCTDISFSTHLIYRILLTKFHYMCFWCIIILESKYLKDLDRDGGLLLRWIFDGNWRCMETAGNATQLPYLSL